MESGSPIIQNKWKIWICVRIKEQDTGHCHDVADIVHLWEVLWLYTTLLHSVTDKLTSVTICNSDGYIRALTFSFVFVLKFILALSDNGVGEYNTLFLPLVVFTHCSRCYGIKASMQQIASVNNWHGMNMKYVWMNNFNEMKKNVLILICCG